MEPAYNKVAALVEQEKLTDLVVLAKMDGTANESAVESIQVEGFPTIFFVKAGQKEPIEYDGGRKAEVLTQKFESDRIPEKLGCSVTCRGSATSLQLVELRSFA